jgi:hypothetical protein
MDLVRRAQDILLKPKETWAVIDTEPGDARTLYTQYLMILALIPAVASFVGFSLLGMGAFGFSMRMPVVWGLTHAIVHYVLTLVMVYVLALIVDALAPGFGGVKNPAQALKLVVYSMTAGLVGGIFMLLPALSILGLLASLYGIYLFYLGLPVLMKCPQDKAVAYTAVVGVLALVAGIVVGSIANAATFGGSHFASMAGDGARMTITTPKGDVTLDSAKIAAAGEQIKAAAERMQQQSQLGAIAPDQLKALLPDALPGDLKRESLESVGDGQSIVSTATGTYRNGPKDITLAVADVGGGLGAAMTMWASLTVDRDTATETERIYRDGDRSIHEKTSKSDGRSEYQVVAPNGVLLSAEGHGVDLAALKTAVGTIDMAKLQSLPRAPAKAASGA